ncbi:MAG: hypothetical protein KGZ85_07895 [Ignavibacterium sp.]|nr:hypothetical protein [Ignavibacterium sp.]
MNENILIDKNQETIETWAYIEIMGHNRIAGRVSERKVGIQVMLQVDVPKPDEGFSHTELFSPSSIFSIKPTTEEWCRKFVGARVNYDVLPYIPATRQLKESSSFPPSQEELKEQFQAEEAANFFDDEDENEL